MSRRVQALRKRGLFLTLILLTALIPVAFSALGDGWINLELGDEYLFMGDALNITAHSNATNPVIIRILNPDDVEVYRGSWAANETRLLPIGPSSTYGTYRIIGESGDFATETWATLIDETDFGPVTFPISKMIHNVNYTLYGNWTLRGYNPYLGEMWIDFTALRDIVQEYEMDVYPRINAASFLVRIAGGGYTVDLRLIKVHDGLKIKVNGTLANARNFPVKFPKAKAWASEILSVGGFFIDYGDLSESFSWDGENINGTINAVFDYDPIIFTSGLESGSIAGDNWDSSTVVGNCFITVDEASAYRGIYGLNMTMDGVGGDSAYVTKDVNEINLYQRAYFNWTNALGNAQYYSPLRTFGSNTISILRIIKNATHYNLRIYLRDGAGYGALTDVAIDWVEGTRYRFEMQTYLDNVNGFCAVWMNGSLIDNVTGYDTDNFGNIVEARFGETTQSKGGTDNQIYADQLVVSTEYIGADRWWRADYEEGDTSDYDGTTITNDGHLEVNTTFPLKLGTYSVNFSLSDNDARVANYTNINLNDEWMYAQTWLRVKTELVHSWGDPDLNFLYWRENDPGWSNWGAAVIQEIGGDWFWGVLWRAQNNTEYISLNTTSAFPPTFNETYCVEWFFNTQVAGNGTSRMWVNGTLVCDLVNLNTSNWQMDRLYGGMAIPHYAGNGNYWEWYQDNVTYSESYIGFHPPEVGGDSYIRTGSLVTFWTSNIDRVWNITREFTLPLSGSWTVGRVWNLTRDMSLPITSGWDVRRIWNLTRDMSLPLTVGVDVWANLTVAGAVAYIRELGVSMITTINAYVSTVPTFSRVLEIAYNFEVNAYTVLTSYAGWIWLNVLVENIHGRALANAVVTLWNETSGLLIATETTNSTGYIPSQNVTVGDFTIQVLASAYEAYLESFGISSNTLKEIALLLTEDTMGFNIELFIFFLLSLITFVGMVIAENPVVSVTSGAVSFVCWGVTAIYYLYESYAYPGPALLFGLFATICLLYTLYAGWKLLNPYEMQKLEDV